MAVFAVTFLSVVCSRRHNTFLAFSASLAAAPVRKTVSDGALGFLLMLMISFRRGTPSVTFLDDTPAKWKVLSVICVAGSPNDCAANAPTISPGLTCACWNLVSISPISHSKASDDSLNSSETHLVHSVERTRHWNSRVAFSLACLLRWSSPATMMHFFKRSLTPWITLSGLRSVGARLLIWNIFCTFQIIRCRLQGNTTLLSPLGKICRSASRSFTSCSHSFSNSDITSPLPISSFRISSLKILRRYLSFVGSNLNFFSKALFDNLIVGRFWNSTVSPHRPSSPYRNWINCPTELRTVPS